MNIVIKVVEVIGELCMTPYEGSRLYELIYIELINGRSIELDFKGVRICIPPFMNYALGILYKSFSNDVIEERLRIINMNDVSQASLFLVKENSSNYFTDINVQRAVDNALEAMQEYIDYK